MLAGSQFSMAFFIIAMHSREESINKIAYVTFRDLKGVETAVLLTVSVRIVLTLLHSIPLCFDIRIAERFTMILTAKLSIPDHFAGVGAVRQSCEG